LVALRVLYITKQKYLREMPFEIRQLVSPLHDDTHWAVYLALHREGKQTIPSLKDKSGIQQRELEKILKDLKSAG
jgi:hypothetical protein